MFLCYECWSHIFEFFRFQEKVDLAQTSYDKVIRNRSYSRCIIEELVIKREQPLEALLSKLESEPMENSLDNSSISKKF